MLVGAHNEGRFLSMRIRQATPADHAHIYALVREAFRTAPVSDGTEQDFVLKLRAGAHIPELELVAEEKDRLIGHVMLTGATICHNRMAAARTLLLSPLSVAFEHRGQGTGSRLVSAALKRAERLGHEHVVLVGDPAYYGRFGFQKTFLAYGRIPEQYILALEIVPGSLNNIQGEICPDFQKSTLHQGDQP